MRVSNPSSQSGAVFAARSGRHRRHGRYPAVSASTPEAKYSTLRGKGFRAAHDGTQNTPVVRTLTKNTPS
jgi:hypothetical protein